MRSLVNSFYAGSNATKYDESRNSSKKWRFEQGVVTDVLSYLAGDVSSLADVPVGTGRFLQLYRTLDYNNVVGYDLSEPMLAEAEKVRASGQKLFQADLLTSPLDTTADLVVCCRFLNLLDADQVTIALTNLILSCGSHLLFSVRLAKNVELNTKIENKIFIHSEDLIRNILEKNFVSIEKEYIYLDERPGKYVFLLCSIID